MRSRHCWSGLYCGRQSLHTGLLLLLRQELESQRSRFGDNAKPSRKSCQFRDRHSKPRVVGPVLLTHRVAAVRRM